MVTTQIILEDLKNGYLPGQKVSGTVQIHVRKRKKVKYLHVSAKGHGNIQYHRSLCYFKVWKTNLTLISRETELGIGIHNYEFQFNLPNNLPSTVNLQYGCINYEMKAILARPWKIDLKTKKPFHVINKIDLNFHPELQVQTILSNNTIFASIPRIGFTALQTIPVNVVLKNPEDNSISEIACSLSKLIKYKYTDPFTFTYSQELKEKIQKVSQPFRSGKENYEYMVKIPNVIASSYNWNIDKIEIRYILSKNGRQSGAALYFPIVIAA